MRVYMHKYALTLDKDQNSLLNCLTNLPSSEEQQLLINQVKKEINKSFGTPLKCKKRIEKKKIVIVIKNLKN